MEGRTIQKLRKEEKKEEKKNMFKVERKSKEQGCFD